MRNLKYLQQCQTEKGFTLLEILVAVFITTLVITLVYSSFFQILDAKEKVEKELDLLHEARVIFSRMNKDLTNVYPRGRVSGLATSYPYVYFKGSKDGENSKLQLSSYTRNLVNFNRESDQSEVTYFLEKIDEDNFDEDNPVYALVRRENPWIGNENGGTQYAISERVSKFRITYLNSKRIEDPLLKQDDIEEWNANVLGGAYPKVVEVELVLKNETGEDREFKSTIFLPITK
ncbi:MAG: PulJ/GspJ family protein [Thermodesulfobacteriota bacterium]